MKLRNGVFCRDRSETIGSATQPPPRTRDVTRRPEIFPSSFRQDPPADRQSKHFVPMFLLAPPSPSPSAATFGARRLGHVPGIDGLRGIAVALVLTFHAELGTVSGGFLGVEAFFVISGFLVTTLLLERSSETGRVDVGAFLLGRVKRLLPALFVTLLGALSLSAWCARDALSQTWSEAPWALLGASNLFHLASERSYFMAGERPPLLLHLWSLAIEWQFYLALPLLLALVPLRRARLPLCLGATAVALASSLWMAWLHDPLADTSRVYFATDTRLSGLALGSALAFGRSWQAQRSRPRLGTVWLDAAAVLALGLFGFVLFRARGFDAWLYRGGFLAVDVMTAILILAAVRRSVIGVALGVAPLAWLGRRSYALYLVHFPIFAVTRPELDNSWPPPMVLAVRLLATFALAELSYRSVEQPLRRADWTPLGHLLRTLARTPNSGLAVACLTLVLPLHDAPANPSKPTRPTVAEVTVGAVALRRELNTDAPPLTAVARAERNLTSPPASTRVARPPRCGIPVDPAWPKTLTVLTDSVTLPIRKPLEARMPGYRVEVVGRPALMVKQVVGEFLKDRGVGSIVVIGLAYNSLFEKERKNFDTWSRRWDRDAERLLGDLRARRAKKVVWVTLREPSLERVTPQGEAQHRLYAWFFPYVNERLRALSVRHPELGIADWQAVSDIDGITKDLIHLNDAGLELMARTIASAALGDACSGPNTVTALPPSLAE